MPQKKRFTPTKQLKYLDLIGSGVPKGKALDELNLDWNHLRYHRKTDPEFLKLEVEVTKDYQKYASERIETQVVQQAINGHFPSQKYVLASFARERWTIDGEPVADTGDDLVQRLAAYLKMNEENADGEARQ